MDEINKETQDKSRQNKNFVQFYRPFMDEIGIMGKENFVALQLFLFITKHMDNNNALGVSMMALHEILGYSRQSLSKAVKYLKEKGWLCVIKSGTTNIYILNPSIVWTSYDGQKQYCKFQTNVIVTPTENAEYLNNLKSNFKFKQIDNDFILTMKKQQEEYLENIKQHSDILPCNLASERTLEEGE